MGIDKINTYGHIKQPYVLKNQHQWLLPETIVIEKMTGWVVGSNHRYQPINTMTDTPNHDHGKSGNEGWRPQPTLLQWRNEGVTPVMGG